MGGKRRLSAGVPRLLSRYDNRLGRLYCRVSAELVEDLGIGSKQHALLRQVGQVAALWVTFQEATGRLEEAQEQREGKGRRPSPAMLARLQHRQMVANAAYQSALAALREAASPWKRPR